MSYAEHEAESLIVFFAFLATFDCAFYFQQADDTTSNLELKAYSFRLNGRRNAPARSSNTRTMYIVRAYVMISYTVACSIIYIYILGMHA